jgi:cytoskeleton protein RodZ
LEQNEAEVGAFGEQLRREREMRHISLDEIAATTKIGTRLLRALEEEQFELLPGGIFNKGYVRAYAKYVGIDEEKAIAGYLQALHDAPSHAVTDPILSMRFEQSSREVAPARPRAPLPVVPILIAVVLLAGIAGGWRVYRERQRDRRQQAVVAVRPDTKPTSSGVTSQGGTGVSTSANPAERRPSTQLPATVPTSLATATNNVASPAGTTSFELTVRPRNRAWISIKSDGKFVMHGVIKPPEVKTVRATNQVVFWTGNAGAVEVSFNGKNVPLSGGENEERVLVFNSRGLLPPSAPQ